MSTTITGLPNATTPLTGAERVPMDQAGATKDATTQDIANLAPATDLTYTAATRTLNSSTGADVVLPVATTTDAGLQSAADKTKLDSIVVDRATLITKLVRNNTGSTIPKGSAVYVVGSSGTTITVALADASLEATAANTIGIAQAAIANNTEGYIVAVGVLDGIDTSALVEGATIWLSETAGGLTTTRPTQPAHGVALGYCVKQSPGAAGIIYVKVDNGLELEELHDVLVTGATSGQVLYKAADGLWKPKLLDGTNLANTAVTAGSYTNASVTVDAQGRLTAASSGTAPVTSVSATGPISSSGGTTPTISTSMATNRLLGRGSAGTGVAEEITLGTNLSLSGTTLNATGGGTPGGSDGQIQVNDGGVFAGFIELLWNKITKIFTVKGDIKLDDGGNFTTTVQCVTPLANRTISFPDATGTVGLVAGSSTAVIYNNAGAYAGSSSLTFDTTNGLRTTLSFGYGTGAGGTVTQATSKSTGVTLNTRCGDITMNAAALAANDVVSFTLTNSQIAATDTLIINHCGAGTLGAYYFGSRCAAGSATISVRNLTAGSLSEALVLRFALIKTVTA